MANILNKDSAVYLQERELFINELRNFHEQKGTPFRTLPAMNGTEIDLYLLYWLVTSQGGLEKVNNRNGWDELLEVFGYTASIANGALALKNAYLRYLDMYEKFYFVGDEDDADDNWYNDDEDSRSKRRKAQKHLNNMPLTYNIKQHNISDAQRIAHKLSTEMYRKSEYDRLVLSLSSPLPNEQDFAINVCTLLSNEGRHTLKLDKCPRLLDILLAHAGVYNHHSFREYMSNLYQDKRRYYLKSFWKDVCQKSSAMELIYDEKFIYSGHQFFGLSVSTTSSRASDDEELFPWWETVSEGSISDEIDKELFAVQRCGGTRELTGQRVLQIATIVRNISFEEDNVVVLAKSLSCLRFCLLCVNSSWSNLNQMGFDILSNISSDIVLCDPEEVNVSEVLCTTLSDCISSSDRFQVISSLNILTKLCQVYLNQVFVVESVLHDSVYQQLVSYLSLHDIHLLVSTLECLYLLSCLSDTTCNAIVRTHGAIDALVSLITVEAQSYGPKACILMRVVETVPSTAPEVVLPSVPVAPVEASKATQNISAQLSLLSPIRPPVSGSKQPTTMSLPPLSVSQLRPSIASSIQLPLHPVPISMSPKISTNPTFVTISRPLVPVAKTQQTCVKVIGTPNGPQIQSPTPLDGVRVVNLPPNVVGHPVGQVFSISGTEQVVNPVSGVQSVESPSVQLQTSSQSSLPSFNSTVQNVSNDQQRQKQNVVRPLLAQQWLNMTQKQIKEKVALQQFQDQRLQNRIPLTTVSSPLTIKIQEHSPILTPPPPTPPQQPPLSQEENKKQVQLRLSNAEEDRQLCLTWIRSTYELSTGSTIEQGIMYKQYMASLHKRGRNDVVSPQYYAACVRTIFGGCVGPNRKTNASGASEYMYEGVRIRSTPIPFKIPPSKSVQTTVQTACSPILTNLLHRNPSPQINMGTVAAADHASPNVLVVRNGVPLPRTSSGTPDFSQMNGNDTKSSGTGLNSNRKPINGEHNGIYYATGEKHNDGIVPKPLAGQLVQLTPDGRIIVTQAGQVSSPVLQGTSNDARFIIKSSITGAQQMVLTAQSSDDSSASKAATVIYVPQTTMISTIAHQNGPIYKVSTSGGASSIPISSQAMVNGVGTGQPQFINQEPVYSSSQMLFQNPKLPPVNPTTQLIVNGNTAGLTISALPPAPLDLQSPFLCEWQGCMRAFKSGKEVEVHVINNHCSYEKVDMNDDIPCLWLRCDGMKRKRFSLMTHIQERHCNPQMLKMMAIRRLQLAQSGKSDVPLPPSAPLHPGYAPNAALHAIKRHASEFSNPKELAMRDDKEGPVTKSIRLTSALIIKNLVMYSNNAISKLRLYESHLSTIALSSLEASRTVSQILYEMSDRGAVDK